MALHLNVAFKMSSYELAALLSARMKRESEYVEAMPRAEDTHRLLETLEVWRQMALLLAPPDFEDPRAPNEGAP